MAARGLRPVSCGLHDGKAASLIAAKASVSRRRVAGLPISCEKCVFSCMRRPASYKAASSAGHEIGGMHLTSSASHRCSWACIRASRSHIMAMPRESRLASIIGNMVPLPGGIAARARRARRSAGGLFNANHRASARAPAREAGAERRLASAPTMRWWRAARPSIEAGDGAASVIAHVLSRCAARRWRNRPGSAKALPAFPWPDIIAKSWRRLPSCGRRRGGIKPSRRLDMP